MILALDIGGTAVKLGLVDQAGTVHARSTADVCFDGYRTPVFDTVLAAARRFLREMGTSVEGSVGEDTCQLGPYVHLRPLSVLKKGAKVGNFSEIKKSVIGEGSKVNHLSYIGDTQMGAGVNVGAGTITCNYDGKNKHETIIEDHVFIGSNVNFVAPVTVREYAKIGAGSTITKEVPSGALGIARARQVVLEKKGVNKND